MESETREQMLQLSKEDTIVQMSCVKEVPLYDQ